MRLWLNYEHFIAYYLFGVCWIGEIFKNLSIHTATYKSLFVIFQNVKGSRFNPPPPSPKFSLFFRVTVFQETSAFKFVGAFRFPQLWVGVLQFKPRVVTLFESAQFFQKCRSNLKIVATEPRREASFTLRTHRY